VVVQVVKNERKMAVAVLVVAAAAAAAVSVETFLKIVDSTAEEVLNMIGQINMDIIVINFTTEIMIVVVVKIIVIKKDADNDIYMVPTYKKKR